METTSLAVVLGAVRLLCGPVATFSRVRVLCDPFARFCHIKLGILVFRRSGMETGQRKRKEKQNARVRTESAAALLLQAADFVAVEATSPCALLYAVDQAFKMSK